MRMKQGYFSIMAVVAISMFAVKTALADATVVYKMTGPDGHGSQTIYYADKRHVRVDIANDAARHDATMMKLGDKVYMITGKVVQDMDQLAEMMAMMGKGAKNRQTKPAPIKYEDTGRTETIAGITGKVYSFVERGKQHEVVLGRDKDLQDAALGVVEIAKAMSAAMPSESRNMMEQNSPIKSMAMLRLDHYMQLQSINKKRIQASVFKLPAKPQQLGGGLGGLMKNLMGR